MPQSKDPTIVKAFIPVIFLVIFISINVFIFGDSALDGSNQIILILSAAVVTYCLFFPDRKKTQTARIDSHNGYTEVPNKGYGP